MTGVVSAIERLIEEPKPEPRPPLVMAGDASWFEVPGTGRIDLSRRKPLRLLLARLLQERRDQPGHALRVEALLSAGWPGERVIPEAGAARVYVAVSTLRKLGLRTVLRSREDGYLLDPSIDVITS